jgi:rhodanese-related sulfurtransferase
MARMPAMQEMRRVVLETLLVAVLGVVVALIANFISPRGLSITRDYFPERASVQADAAVATLAGGIEPQRITSASTPAIPITGGPAGTGIGIVSTEQALGFFRDPLYEQELIVFVDARDSRHYEAGHIPGAYQLDRYYPQNHLPTVLPACLNATRVVVYCAGGECEDSHFSAQLLQDAGIPVGQLFIYAGGITEWDAQRLPIETGARKSGILRERKP